MARKRVHDGTSLRFVPYYKLAHPLWHLRPIPVRAALDVGGRWIALFWGT